MADARPGAGGIAIALTLSGWLLTAWALVLLTGAALLVRFVRLSAWERSLGRSGPGEQLTEIAPSVAVTQSGSAHLRKALRVGRCVARAADILPFATRCLPRAIAVQWMLRLRQIPSVLVIAVHVRDRVGEHAYHAWAETGGVLVIGHCDRSLYRPVMVIRQPAAAIP